MRRQPSTRQGTETANRKGRQRELPRDRLGNRWSKCAVQTLHAFERSRTAYLRLCEHLPKLFRVPGQVFEHALVLARTGRKISRGVDVTADGTKSCPCSTEPCGAAHAGGTWMIRLRCAVKRIQEASHFE